MRKFVKVNLGCGSHVPEAWVNVDYALGARLAKIPLMRHLNKTFHFFHTDWNPAILIHNLRRTFPFKDNSVEIIYTSHLLEHFTKEEGGNFLTECHRILRPNGILRVVVPDLKALVAKYTNGEIPADDFIDEIAVSCENPGWGSVKKRLALFIQFPHKCMYDTCTLLLKMEKIGFKAESKNPFESDIPDIASIELPGRTENAVIIEGIKM